jgi:putative transposase
VYIPGATVFRTVVTNERTRLFSTAENIMGLRQSMRQVMEESPFRFLAAVVLPDHFPSLWSLPEGDVAYSRRIGRLKVLFTRFLHAHGRSVDEVSSSRRRHRESDVWHRRFWEHTIRDEEEFEQHLNYIHYNPVKHECVTCPHLWPYSSFSRWVRSGLYDEQCGCRCDGRRFVLPNIARVDGAAGEWG